MGISPHSTLEHILSLSTRSVHEVPTAEEEGVGTSAGWGVLGSVSEDLGACALNGWPLTTSGKDDKADDTEGNA